MRTFLLDNNNNKEEVMYPAIVDVFLVKADNNKNNTGNDGDANGGIVGGANAGSSGFSTSFAAVLSSFAFSSTHGAGGAFAVEFQFSSMTMRCTMQFGSMVKGSGISWPIVVRSGPFHQARYRNVGTALNQTSKARGGRTRTAY